MIFMFKTCQTCTTGNQPETQTHGQFLYLNSLKYSKYCTAVLQYSTQVNVLYLYFVFFLPVTLHLCP